MPYIAMTVMVFHIPLGTSIQFSGPIESYAIVTSSVADMEKLQIPQQLNQTTQLVDLHLLLILRGRNPHLE